MNIFIRVIIAVIAFLLFITLVPLIATVLSITLSAALFQILKICAAGIAIFYIIAGPNLTINR